MRKKCIQSRILIILLGFLISLSSCQKEVTTETENEKGIPTEFVKITVDGTSHTWYPNPNKLYSMEDTVNRTGFYYNMLGAFDTTAFGAIDMVLLRPAGTLTNFPLHFDIESITIVGANVFPESLPGYYFPQLVSQATITEFGSIGQYCSGNFSGIYERSRISDLDTVTVSCSWRIKREPF